MMMLFLFFLVLILPTQRHHKDTPYDSGHQFGEDNGIPDAVNTKQQRQQEHSAEFKHKGTQKGDECRDLPIVQRGKEGRAEDSQAREQVGDRDDPEGVYGIRQQIRRVLQKQGGKRMGQRF